MHNKLVPTIIAASLFMSMILTATLQSSEEDGKLGPVDSITLAGADGDITISNADKHLSWGEEKTSRAWSIGFMETTKALEQLMQADHFVEVRDELDEELDESLKEAREILDEIANRGRALKPDDPEKQEVRQQWENAYRNFEQLQKEGMQIRGKLASEQMQEAFNEVLEAVNVVSDRLNIDIVLRFIPPDGEFERNTPDATLMQIRLRTALRLPKDIDITDEVLSELGLEVQ